MAKRGTLTHRRTRRLAAALRIPLPYALGLMEALWHVTAEHAPAGDVGRMSDEDLCDELYWDQDPGELVAAFVRAGVLEQHPDHRLVVHGWSEHADNALRHKLNRARSTFWDGESPFKRRDPATDHDQTASSHDEPPDDADQPRQDEIEPASASVQQPAPASSNQRPTDNTPPGPPASRVGTGAAGKVFWVGDKLGDGRVVLEVDEAGRVVVVSRGEGTAPTLAPDGREAIDRIVAYASKALGARFDRADRRRLRERLLGGETEAQILAGYRAQVAALEALEATDDPPGEGDDEDLDQALRLAGAAPQSGLAAAGRSDT